MKAGSSQHHVPVTVGPEWIEIIKTPTDGKASMTR